PDRCPTLLRKFPLRSSPASAVHSPNRTPKPHGITRKKLGFCKNHTKPGAGTRKTHGSTHENIGIYTKTHEKKISEFPLKSAPDQRTLKIPSPDRISGENPAGQITIQNPFLLERANLIKVRPCLK